MGAPGALRSEHSGCSQWTPRACGYPHTFCGWISVDLPRMLLQANQLFPAWIPLTNLRNSFCTNKPPPPAMATASALLTMDVGVRSPV